jgi:hypothetical protein
MNRKAFEKSLRVLRDDITDMNDAWETYKDLSEEVQLEGDRMETLHSLVGMNSGERLIWRMVLAEEGIELTPDQVEEYLHIVEVVIN